MHLALQSSLYVTLTIPKRRILNTVTWVALVSSLLGGTLVAIITQLSTNGSPLDQGWSAVD